MISINNIIIITVDIVRELLLSCDHFIVLILLGFANMCLQNDNDEENNNKNKNNIFSRNNENHNIITSQQFKTKNSNKK